MTWLFNNYNEQSYKLTKYLFATASTLINSKFNVTDGNCYCCLHVTDDDDTVLCTGCHTLSTKADTSCDSSLPAHDDGHLRLG